MRKKKQIEWLELYSGTSKSLESYKQTWNNNHQQRRMISVYNLFRRSYPM
jgi:hypothetical protein